MNFMPPSLRSLPACYCFATSQLLLGLLREAPLNVDASHLRFHLPLPEDFAIHILGEEAMTRVSATRERATGIQLAVEHQVHPPRVVFVLDPVELDRSTIGVGEEAVHRFTLSFRSFMSEHFVIPNPEVGTQLLSLQHRARAVQGVAVQVADSVLVVEEHCITPPWFDMELQPALIHRLPLHGAGCEQLLLQPLDLRRLFRVLL